MSIRPTTPDPMEERIRFAQMDREGLISTEAILENGIRQGCRTTENTIAACGRKLEQQQRNSEAPISGFIEELTQVPLFQAAENQKNNLLETLTKLQQLRENLQHAFSNARRQLRENIEHKKGSEAELQRLTITLRDAERHGNRTQNIILSCGERVCHKISHPDRPLPDNYWRQMAEQHRRAGSSLVLARQNLSNSLKSLKEAQEQINGPLADAQQRLTPVAEMQKKLEEARQRDAREALTSEINPLQPLSFSVENDT